MPEGIVRRAGPLAGGTARIDHQARGGRAIGQLRREHATVAGLARRLGTSWKTVWLAVEPELVRLAADESRFENVTSLGVDEHVWHHVDPRDGTRWST